MSFTRRASHALFILLVLFCAAVLPVYAEDIIVSSVEDTDDGTCDALNCTLREAINRANTDPGTNVITFDSVVFADTKTIFLDSALPILSSDITLVGSGAARLTLVPYADGAFDIFTVTDGVTVNISGMTIRGIGYDIFNEYGLINISMCKIDDIFNESGTIELNNCNLQRIFTLDETTINNSTIGSIDIDGLLSVKDSTVGSISNFGVVNADNCTINNGIRKYESSHLAVSNCIISGAGIRQDWGTLIAINCTIRGSLTGIYSEDGTVTFNKCTVSGNVIGIHNEFGAVDATNCTISGNVTGIDNESGVVDATNCTISGNVMGINNRVDGEAVLRNTLCTGNATNASGIITDGGHNIISGTAAEAGLDPNGLQNNGGPTQTIALIGGSPALNAGDNTLIPSDVTTDQRGPGFQRINGSTVDIGAFEAFALTINNINVVEGNSGTSNATFTITLSAASSQTVTVNYASGILGGVPATSGVDFVAVAPNMLTFAPGETTKTVTVQVKGDTLNEVNERFAVNLLGSANAVIFDGEGIATITDDDPEPSLSINNVTVTEGNNGSVNANFIVTLSAVSGKNVTVKVATSAPSSVPATASVDYVAVPLTLLTFASGETSKAVSIQIKGDTLDEVDERLAVNLSAPTNATLGDKEGVGTITDDDTAPSLVINNVTVPEGNVGTVNANFTVTLSAASGKTVTVQYNTAVPGSYPATAGTDYVAVPTTTLTFTPGQTSKTVTVLLNGDLLDEDNERFAVNLKSASNATLADNEGLGTITDDDALPGLSINDVSLSEGNSGTSAFIFTVTLSAASGRKVTVKAQTLLPSSLIATPGVDYTALPLTTLTFTPGQMVKTVTVLVNGDTNVEGTERFAVKLSAQTNSTIIDNEGVGSIFNDDAASLLTPLSVENDAPSE